MFYNRNPINLNIQRQTNSNFILPVYASAGVVILKDPVVRVPVKAVRELLGSAERCRTRKGQDVCGSAQVSID
jgi:hypothetical protein